MLDGLPAFRESAGLKHMDHARPDLEPHIDPVSSSPGRHADTVVTEHLMFANLDQQGRDAGVVAEYRRGERVAGIPPPR